MAIHADAELVAKVRANHRRFTFPLYGVALRKQGPLAQLPPPVCAHRHAQSITIITQQHPRAHGLAGHVLTGDHPLESVITDNVPDHGLTPIMSSIMRAA